MQLREYQTSLIEQINNAWREGDRRVLAQLPTAGGKTVLFSHISKDVLNQGGSVLVVAHRKELITQAASKLETVSGLPCGIIKAGYPRHEILPIQIASIQSIVRREKPPADLVIVDEAHHAIAKSYQDVLDRYPNAYILGMTATPCRSDGQGFKDTFDRLVCGVSVTELIELGYLSKFKVFKAASISTKGVRKVAGDYNQKQLEEAAAKVIGEIVPAYQKIANGKSNLVFAVSVEASKQIAAKFCETGISAEHLDGETPDDERDRIFARFRDKQTTVLCNVNVATEGTDIPGIECVQVCRPTMSLPLHLQMLGRGLRIAEGKEFCYFIDHTDNWQRLGLPDDDHEWSLNPISLKPSRFTQICPECEHVFSPLSHEQKPVSTIYEEETGKVIHNMKAKCPNCGGDVTWQQGEGGEAQEGRVIDKEVSELEELDLTVSNAHKELIDATIRTAIAKGYKLAWAFHHVLEMPESDEFSYGEYRYLCRECRILKSDIESAFKEFKEERDAIAHQPLGELSEAFTMMVDMLCNTAKDKGYKSGWIFYRVTEVVKEEPSLIEWQYLADVLGYSDAWAAKQKAQCKLPKIKN